MTITKEQTEEYIGKCKRIVVSDDVIQDAVNIFNGVYAPLTGFLKAKDFQSVVNKMRLVNGQVWSIPIVLPLGLADRQRIKNEKCAVLTDWQRKSMVILDGLEIYDYDKAEMANKIFGTLDNNHPGVTAIQSQGDYLVGGKVVYASQEKIWPEYNLSPAETKKIFQGRGWQSVVAFQTRNVPHLGHEYLQKYALQNVDGLLIHPVIGEKKKGDFRDEHILSSYQALIDKYYPRNKVVLSILPLKMKYAGPREAVMHALIRRNFGCTHFIVGRDHAGVGNYYPPLAAHKIFDEFSKDEIGIEILKYPAVVFDKNKRKHCFIDKCLAEDQFNFSGTMIRELINNKKQPPGYLMRPEVFKILTDNKKVFVSDEENKAANKAPGFVLWLTGLSAAGKSTIADKVYEKLLGLGVKTERLDGDIVREDLTKDLGFSKEDRDENIRRVGYVAKILSRNEVGVLASFISPYKSHRNTLRIKIPNFIEVFVDAPIEVCEKRDRKGIYAKAKKGEIKNFTGISDPYEKPENPEIHLRTDKMSVDKSARAVIDYLKNKNYL